MRAAWLLGAALVVSACDTTPVAREASDAARVADVTIRPSVLTITMTDGARCVAERPESETSGWSGTTDNCGYALPFSVLFFAGSDNPARFTVEKPFDVIGTDGGLMPRAEVYITDVDGVQKQFVSSLSNARVEVAPAS